MYDGSAIDPSHKSDGSARAEAGEAARGAGVELGGEGLGLGAQAGDLGAQVVDDDPLVALVAQHLAEHVGQVAHDVGGVDVVGVRGAGGGSAGRSSSRSPWTT